MAEVKAPLFSEEAYGKFGKCLVFGKSEYNQTVRFCGKPPKGWTEPQKVCRVFYGMIIADWRITPVGIRATYEARAKGTHLLATNVFYQDFFKWMFSPRYGETHYGTARYSKV